MKTRDSYSKAIYFWREAASACRPQLISHWQSFNSRPCCKVLGWTIQRARARCSRCVSVEHQFCGCWPNNFHVAEIEITVGMFHFNQLVSGLKGEGACWIEHPRPFLTPEVGKGPSSACSQRRQKLRRKFGHSMTKLKGVFLHITAWQTQNVISESISVPCVWPSHGDQHCKLRCSCSSPWGFWPRLRCCEHTGSCCSERALDTRW